MSQTVALLTDQEMNRLPAPTDAGFGTLRSERGPFPLQALSVRAAIDGLLAEVEVCQTYVNVFAEPLEATYIFPLPDRAAVSSFVMEVAGRRIEGVLKERGKARQEYDAAIQAGQRAAISEEERSNVFTLRVGNLLAQEHATIRFRLVMPLLFSDGEATFRFPLVVAPRYIPGEPLPGPGVGAGTEPDTDAVPDASRISPPVLLPGFPNPVRLALSAAINPGGLPLTDLKSSLHGVCVSQAATGTLQVDLQPGERLNRDFVLRFRLGDRAVQTSLLLHPEAAHATEGTFTLTLVPPVESGHRQKPRDLVFLLDRSGSMAGWKMVAARRALAHMIDTLTEADRFNVFAFDDEVQLPTGFTQTSLQPATHANRFRCTEWLRGVSDGGGTELYQPLDAAVNLLASSPVERERGLVLLTDGQVGNEADILKMLGQRLAGLRIFTLGIDQAVNEGFLKRLAQLGGGATEIVESEERLDEVMGKIHRRLGTPVLTAVQLKGEGLKLDLDSLTPHRLPDLFTGSPLVIAGRYQGQAGGSIAVQARDAAGRPWHAAASGAVTSNPAHTKLWARNRLRDLEDLYDSGVSDGEALEKHIVEVSLHHGVLCRFTSFVAVDRSESANTSGTLHQFVQPVDAPAGWDMLRRQRALPAGGAMFCMAVPSRAAGPMAAPMDFDMMGVESVDSYLAEFESVPAAPAPEAPAPSEGFFRKVMKIFKHGQAEEEADLLKCATPPQGLDLAAYRRRAADLLQLLQAGAGQPLSDRLTTLGLISERLRELLEDMASVGVSAAEMKSLHDMAAVLAHILTAPAPTEPEVQVGWDQAERVLADFTALGAVSTKPSTPPKRKAFWK